MGSFIAVDISLPCNLLNLLNIGIANSKQFVVFFLAMYQASCFYITVTLFILNVIEYFL